MLSKKKNELITPPGPATPLGNGDEQLLDPGML